MTDDRIKPDNTEKDDSEAPDAVPEKRDEANVQTLPPPPGTGEYSSLEDIRTFPPEEGEPSDIPERWGKMLAGRFELLEKIGEGGMGSVFRARDTELDEIIAVKVLQRSYTQSTEDVQRFKREIKTARRITHLNVIRIHEFGIAEGEAFICMEYLSGGSLADLIYAGRVPFDRAMEIALQMAAGVGAAHSEGIVHRDLKPHNVLLDDKGTIKLLDFGIARFTASTKHTAGIMGTPHYMSPEQADALPVTKQSDVYSLGICYFELFTGELPFTGDGLAKLAVAHVTQPPRPPREIEPELDEGVEAIILKCLSKEKEDRYRDANAVENALRAVYDATVEMPRLSAAKRSMNPPVSAPRKSVPDVPKVEESRRGWLTRALILTAIAGLGVLAWAASTGRLSAWISSTPVPTEVAVASKTTALGPTVTTIVETPARTPNKRRTPRKRTPQPKTPTPKRTVKVSTPKPTPLVTRGPNPTPTSRKTPPTQRLETPTPQLGPSATYKVKLSSFPSGYCEVYDGTKRIYRTPTDRGGVTGLHAGQYLVVFTRGKCRKEMTLVVGKDKPNKLTKVDPCK